MLPVKKSSYVSKEFLARNNSLLIRDANNEEIVGAILACCSLVGIKDTPEGLVAKVLISFMVDNLGSYTIKEMLLAFNHVASGKIEISKDKEHYGEFSAKYLGNVMSKYTDYLSRNSLSVYEVIAEKEPTQEEINENNNKAKFSIGAFVVDHLINQKFSDYAAFKSCYWLLKDCGYIKDKPITEKNAIYNAAKKQYILNVKTLTKSEKDSLKSFYLENTRNEHFENVIKDIMIATYKAWIYDNKNVNLIQFKKEFKEKIYETFK